jgi:hypothetical protein
MANLPPLSMTPEVPVVDCHLVVADFPAVFTVVVVVGVSAGAGVSAVAGILLLLTAFLFLVFLLL